MVPADRPVHPAAPPRVLLTGFDPFGGETQNPSWLAVRQLDARHVAQHRVVAAQLPTVFGASLDVLRTLIAEHRPALVICVGQAGGRAAVSLERIAINVDDARIADNAGAQPIDRAIVANGPAAYFTTLPIKAMLRALLDARIAAEVSQTAGTFVCNHVFYGLLHELATQRGLRSVRGGFIHVPWLPGQGTPSMEVADAVRALQIAIKVALTTAAGNDISLAAGALD